METETALAVIERRAFEARVPIYKLCKRASVAPATISRWRNGTHAPTVLTLEKLENALTAIESERYPTSLVGGV